MKTQDDYVQDALDSAYWAYLMGDEHYARQKLLQLVMFLDRQEKGYYVSPSKAKEKNEAYEEESRYAGTQF